MNIQLRNTSLFVGKQRREIDLLSLFRKGSWLLIVLISIVYSVVGSSDERLAGYDPFKTWVQIYLNFLSFAMAVLAGTIIFLRRTNSWMAYATSLMLVTFTATDNGISFWYHIISSSPMPVNFEEWKTFPLALGLFLGSLYMAVLLTSLAFVLMTFPDGNMPSPRSRVLFRLLVVAEILMIPFVALVCVLDIWLDGKGVPTLFVYFLLDIAKGFVLLVLSWWPARRLHRTTDPVQRQQMKWIVPSLSIMSFLYALDSVTILMALFGVQYPEIVDTLLFLVSLIFTYAFIITLFVAILRYRLWDMRFLINKALVYSAMTTILGALAFVAWTLTEDFVQKHPVLGTLILVFFLVLFAPLREALQGLVDRHFKPEEVDFSSAIVELAPDSQLLLSTNDILKILIRQTEQQLDLAHATLYLRLPDRQLVQAQPAAADPQTSQLDLDEKTLARLEMGEVVVPPESSPVSLYVPLLIKRASRPDFLGVLIFGPRNSGEGYSTPVLKSLQKLGCDAGKAIYLAQLREHLGQNMLERLAAIEHGLLSLRQTGQLPSTDPNRPIYPA